MNRVIVADASCLIILQNIQELSLLQKIYSEVVITKEVEEEFGLALPEWIKVEEAANRAQKELLSLFLDGGEASSIALCLERQKSLLIIDEKKGRRIARDLGLEIIGTLGVILKAKENGLINSLKESLEKLEKADFRISPSLKAQILEND